MPRWFRRNWILIVGFVVVVGVVLAALLLESRSTPATDSFITAIATGLIGLFTIVLGLVAWYQLRHAREVDRAYLTVGGNVDEDAAGKKIFRLEIENIGRTAAFVSSYYVKFADFSQVRLPQKAKMVTEDEHLYDDRFGPAGTERSSFKKILTTVAYQGEDIVYGAAWFTDIWQEPHCSRFIMRVDAKGQTRTDVGNVDNEYRRQT